MHRRNAFVTLSALSLATAAIGCSGDRTENLPPIIESVETESAVLDPGGETTVRVTARDPDAGSHPDRGLSSELSASWQVDGEGWSVDGSGETAALSAPETYGHRATVAVDVTDAQGATATAETEVETGGNELPRVVRLTASPNPVAPGGVVDLKAEATDPRGDELDYTWTAPAGWSLGSTNGESVELTAPDESGAEGQIELTVTDGAAGSVDRGLRVETARNSDPQITSLTASPPQVAPDGSAELSVIASDPDGDDLSYDWTAPSPWSVSGSGDQVQVQAPDEYGQHAEVEVAVTDARGQSVTGRVSVGTETNDGPVVQGLTASPHTVVRGGTSQLEISASDPEGGKLSYAWSLSKSGDWSIQENGDRATLSAPDAPGRRVRVTVEVSDPAGTTVRASTLVSTKLNRAPTLASVSASPSVVPPKAAADVEADASDPEGDDLTYNWSVPPDWSTKGGGASIDVIAPPARGERATIQLEVTDPHGGRAMGTASIATRANRAPSVGSVTASPSIVGKKGESTLEVSATDPNGDTLSYTWQIAKGWTEIGRSGSKVKVRAPNAFGQKGRFVVEVSDGNGLSTRGAVAVQTSRNLPPKITKMTGKTKKLKRSETTTVTVQALDPDGDPLTYRWSVPKGWSGSSSSSSIDVTAPKQFSASGDLKVTVSDGSHTVSDQITLRTIDNRPPSIASVSVSPAPILQNGRAKATVSASDPDGDPLSYNWSVNKQGWSTKGSGDKVTVVAANQGGQTATLTAKVDDGRGGTAQKTTSINTKACPNQDEANCDRKIGNGCEVDLKSDKNHCGSCGNTCTKPKDYCDAGKCVKTPPSCARANGLMWCYHPTRCGKPCNKTCSALGLSPVKSNNRWFRAQDSRRECQRISNALGIRKSVRMNSYTYACLEDDYGHHTRNGGIEGPILCSTYSGCPRRHRTNMDQKGRRCGSHSRRSICPCN